MLDPYALEISSDPIGPSLPNADPTVFTSELNRDYDTQQIAPKGIVVTPAANAFGCKPTRAQKDDVIYEMNVRGMTANDNSVPQAERGTYAGAAQKAAYLQSLGVTAVELQPVQEVQNDQDDIYGATHGGAAPPNGDTGWNSGQYYKDNYWGYMTLAYFAPDRRYASNRAPGGPTAEFQAMVKAFHDVGIKVYMDVVYNHTGEGAAHSQHRVRPPLIPSTACGGSTTAPTTNWAVNGQGVVNADYYGANGAGPDYNTYNHVAQNLIVDSLYYWSATMGVDGFRFDEGPMLGNVCESDQPSPQTPNCPTGTGFHLQRVGRQDGAGPHPKRALACHPSRRRRQRTGSHRRTERGGLLQLRQCGPAGQFPSGILGVELHLQGSSAQGAEQARRRHHRTRRRRRRLYRFGQPI